MHSAGGVEPAEERWEEGQRVEHACPTDRHAAYRLDLSFRHDHSRPVGAKAKNRPGAVVCHMVDDEDGIARNRQADRENNPSSTGSTIPSSRIATTRPWWLSQPSNVPSDRNARPSGWVETSRNEHDAHVRSAVEADDAVRGRLGDEDRAVRRDRETDRVMQPARDHLAPRSREANDLGPRGRVHTAGAVLDVVGLAEPLREDAAAARAWVDADDAPRDSVRDEQGPRPLR
jgi:hypothetical protein